MFSSLKNALHRKVKGTKPATLAQPPSSPSIPPSPTSPSSPTAKKSLSLDDFDVLCQIGQGSFGYVYLVKETATGQRFALKQIPKTNVHAETEMRLLGNIGKDANAPRSLISAVASWSDEKNYFILMEWFAGGDLASFLDEHGQPSSEQVRLWMAQLVVAVEALHERKVAHRDIKPANILLTADGNVVLGDLGLAKSFASDSFGSFLKPSAHPTEDAGFTNEKCGTFRWSSPSQQAGSPYNYDTDLWSLGLLLFKLTTGRLPFGADTALTDAEVELAYAIMPIDFKEEDDIDAVTRNLIQGMLDPASFGRLNIQEVKAHAYFRGMHPTLRSPASMVTVSQSEAIHPSVAPVADAVNPQGPVSPSVRSSAPRNSLLGRLFKKKSKSPAPHVEPRKTGENNSKPGKASESTASLLFLRALFKVKPKEVCVVKNAAQDRLEAKITVACGRRSVSWLRRSWRWKSIAARHQSAVQHHHRGPEPFFDFSCRGSGAGFLESKAEADVVWGEAVVR
ncbi:kinase-like domain-containing protein [Roridomyces roridus]|uniref:non-specific serine/threonine protein kinase n=1 Tax=Roridomyces roridus TaxID=1738132 RepID=A0AAD7FEG8_9AGAR|nr:kinase-like domain-containing protein [Roridomyces roridus]